MATSKRRTIHVLENGKEVDSFKVDRTNSVPTPFAADPAWTTNRPELAASDTLQLTPLPISGQDVAAMMGNGRSGTELLPHQIERLLASKR